jgi:outer membrane protein assembly complex protein YaeT
MMLAAFTLFACAWQQPEAPANPGVATRHEVHFEGLSHFSARELLRAAIEEEADLVKNGFRRAEVDDMAFQMEMYALAQGYSIARVRWTSEVRDSVLHATFRVSEGPYCEIKKIVVDGAQHFPAEQLTKFFYPSDHTVRDAHPAFLAGRVNSAPGGIKGLYRAQGFRDVQVDAPEVEFNEERTEASIRCTLREGPRFLIRKIEYRGHTTFADGLLQDLGAELIDQAFFPRRAFELGKRIEDHYADLGYADADVKVETRADAETGRVEFLAQIEEGVRVRLGEVRVRGNQRTNESFLRNRIELRPGDWSNRSKREDSFRNLYRSGLFNRVQIELVGEGEQRDLEIEVEEGFHKEFIVEPGYGSYEKMRLLLGWRNKNIFGTGRILRTELRPSMKSLNALVGITDPWLFESNVELDAPVFYRRRQEPSFTREEAGLAFQFRYPVRRELSLLWGYRVTRSQVSSESAGLPPDILIGDTTLASVFAGPRYDTQNDYFNPTRGGQAWLQFEVGSDLVGSQVEYLRGEVKLSHHWPLNGNETRVFAAGYRTATILPTGETDEVPLQLRLFNGGENSVRSFTESRLGPVDSVGAPLGGEVFNTLNLELRQQLSGALWGGLFFDAGNVALSHTDWFEDLRTGYGIGFRYLLPVGALRVDWGYNPTARGDEDEHVVHLSVGMAF